MHVAPASIMPAAKLPIPATAIAAQAMPFAWQRGCYRSPCLTGTSAEAVRGPWIDDAAQHSRVIVTRADQPEAASAPTSISSAPSLLHTAVVTSPSPPPTCAPISTDAGPFFAWTSFPPTSGRPTIQVTIVHGGKGPGGQCSLSRWDSLHVDATIVTPSRRCVIMIGDAVAR